MDASRHARIKELFLAVQELSPPERAVALDAACAGDASLRVEVESLLAFDRAGDILADRPAASPHAATAASRGDAGEPGIGSDAGGLHAGELASGGLDPLGLVGVTLDDRYRIEALVSEGGFGYVYRAEQIRWARPVAVKVFKLERGDEALRQAFVKEGALLNELSRHTTAIVQSYDVGTLVDGGGRSRVFIVIEWLDGKTLGDLILDERRAAALGQTNQANQAHQVNQAGQAHQVGWPLARVLHVLSPIAEALAVAHARGIAHRDVKPANIFLLDDGATKLLDFGIAKVAAEYEAGFQSTGGAIAAFTVGYAAPEQLSKRHGTTGPWTDVYALALVCVELLAGRRIADRNPSNLPTKRLADAPGRAAPATVESIFASAFAIHAAVGPTPRRLGVAVSSAVENVFARALARDVKERYPDAAAFFSALTAAARQAPSPEPEPEQNPAPAPPPEAVTDDTTDKKPDHEPPGDGAAADGSDADRPVPRSRLWPRLLLAALSCLFTVLMLEGATRLIVKPPAPVLLRDGIYVTQLGKVNGFDSRTIYEGAPLPVQKRKGEIRIAVFGESTVQGSPFEAYGSPVTMLYDHLRATMPDKDFTVLNMGRGGGFTIDAYYFLVTLERFAPDFVIFYQGANDEYNGDKEMCMPATSPRLHRVWRWLVEHSRLLWTVRAEGPAFFVRLKHERREFTPVRHAADQCNPEEGFKGWTDLLVETAQDMGAQVIVTTPVSNPLRWAEVGAQFGIDQPLDLNKKDPHYRRLLACVLTRDCDLEAAWRKENRTSETDSVSQLRCLLFGSCPTGRDHLRLGQMVDGERYAPMSWLRPRVRISLDSAARHGARSIDFHTYLQEHLASGLRPLIFIDEMHLTLDGLWLLSWLWTSEVANLIDGRSLPPLPPTLDSQSYLPAITKNLRRGEACIYLRTIRIFLRANMPLVAAVQLRMAVESEVGTGFGGGALAKTRAGLAGQLITGWLRRELKLDPALPAPLLSRLDGVNLEKITAELGANDDCSTVGGAALDAFIVDKTGGAPPLAAHEKTPAEKAVEESYIIPQDQERTIGTMLQGIAPDGCQLDEAEIKKSYIHTIYKCPGGRTAAVDLHHPLEPSTAGRAKEKTKHFVLVAGDPAPNDRLLKDLAAALRDKEGHFEWKHPTRKDPANAP